MVEIAREFCHGVACCRRGHLPFGPDFGGGDLDGGQQGFLDGWQLRRRAEAGGHGRRFFGGAGHEGQKGQGQKVDAFHAGDPWGSGSPTRSCARWFRAAGAAGRSGGWQVVVRKFPEVKSCRQYTSVGGGVAEGNGKFFARAWKRWILFFQKALSCRRKLLALAVPALCRPLHPASSLRQAMSFGWRIFLSLYRFLSRRIDSLSSVLAAGGGCAHTSPVFIAFMIEKRLEIGLGALPSQ